MPRNDFASSGPRDSRLPINLVLFHTDPVVVAEASAAGAAGFVVDWEIRGKERRQAGEGTQINHDTLDDLRRVRAATSAKVICRLNSVGRWTRREIETAIAAGADEVLLPMVRRPSEVDMALKIADRRCGVGILIETAAAVASSGELCRRPLSRVYLGLNDLRIDRGSRELFRPLVDDTVDYVREQVGEIPFGVAGLTLPDRGSPVPSRLLAAELVRLDADFTFLRRTFLADSVKGGLSAGMHAILDHLQRLPTRSRDDCQADRDEFIRTLVATEAQLA